MFRPLIYPSLGVCDYVVELPHWLYRSANANFSLVAEQYSQCVSSTTQSQNPEDGHINARNMSSI